MPLDYVEDTGRDRIFKWLNHELLPNILSNHVQHPAQQGTSTALDRSDLRGVAGADHLPAQRQLRLGYVDKIHDCISVASLQRSAVCTMSTSGD